MNFRTPKGISGFFKKKSGRDDEPAYENKDFGLEDDWDDFDDRFQEKDDRVVIEDTEPENKSRRLKGKLILGLAGLVLFFLLFSVLSNALAPKKVEENKETAQVSKGSRVTNPAAAVPNNYAEMAKYQRELEARRQAEEAAKNKAQVQQQPKTVYPAPQNVPPPPAPSAPPQPGYTVQAPVAAENPYSSPLSFKMEGNAQAQSAPAATTVSNYGTASPYSSKVDMNSVFTLQAGTVIPATLFSGIDTRMTGDVVAQIRQDVYDSLTGRNLVFPQGSKLIGKLVQGKGRRAGVKFNRIILPDGSNVNLPEQNATDNAGYPGMKDKYDTHDADFWRGSFVGLMTALLADGIDDAMDNKNRYVYNSSSNGNEYIRSNVGEYMDKLSDRLTERASKTEEPNVRIRPGYQFNVFINQDMNVYGYRR